MSLESKVIQATNAKLNNWYATAKRDYNVEGSGVASIKGNTITVDYSEDGTTKTWSMSYYPEYVEDNGFNYFFNVWAEQAR